MNAVLVHDDDRSESLSRRIDGREKSWLECALQAWGNWIEMHSDFEGYPNSDAVAAWLDGRGGGTPGYRVLCLDMPEHIAKTHLRVVSLQEELQAVVWAHYVPVMKESGRVWTDEEKAARLEISWGAYRTRLWRARLRILGIDD